MADQPASPRSAFAKKRSLSRSFSSKSVNLSPNAFKALALGIRGLARAQVIADAGVSHDLDINGLVRRIALTLSFPETYQKVVEGLFRKFAEPCGEGGESQLPVVHVPAILAHWGIPEDHAPMFWAQLRKLEKYFHRKVLPEQISQSDLQEVLVKVLRRVRDKYCTNKVSKSQFVTCKKNFDEEYTMLDLCGKGAFGECFWVSHRVSKSKRVCKKISKAEANVPAEEVASELDILKKLDHPNVLRVFEWFEDNESFRLVVEAAPGGDLKHLLASTREQWQEEAASHPGLEEHLTCQLMHQASQALSYVHSMQVVHRDIKPANLLLASADISRPRLLLADFGVAEIFQESWAVSSALRGTIAYMAPEVFANETSALSDVWALGIVTYELLTAERPFSADNPMAMYGQLKLSSLNLDKVKDAGASEEAVAFIARLLMKDPAKRPSAAEVLSDPWLLESHRENKLSGRKARKARNSLMNFTHMSYVAKASMNCIAAQMDSSKLEGLSDVFQSLDTDGDGKLSAAELAAGLAELGIDPDNIQQLLSTVDMDGDGSIQYSEFVASLLHAQGRLVDDVVFHAFHVFDMNGDGHISLDELRTILSGNGPLAAVLPDGQTVEQAMVALDSSGDGVVSFDEFKAYLSSQWERSSLKDELAAMPEADATDTLEWVLRQLSAELGKSEAELSLHARRLQEEHWINTVGDLHKLNDLDWPRLGLPLKLERVLRKRIGA
eukprot:TRINITY_DN40012_c0_g1_i1.p1 TRINITY_DN40012_c0_g1~~TRINITY_DN40012_c0_g1_i1.p1  ORF type:complete len:726 (+),score=202.35 TRINITY_DN40012_c0_g1_i1:74-2251(+)